MILYIPTRYHKWERTTIILGVFSTIEKAETCIKKYKQKVIDAGHEPYLDDINIEILEQQLDKEE